MFRGRTKEFIRLLKISGYTVAAAESCTAGMAAALIAGIPGASRVLWGSFVCYTPEAKFRMLGVGEDVLRQFGAVSRETACAMADGALEKSGADCAFSITGIAGPGTDDSGLPAGTVWIGTVKRGGKAEAAVFNFSGSRNRIRRKAAEQAFYEIMKILPKTNTEKD